MRVEQENTPDPGNASRTKLFTSIDSLAAAAIFNVVSRAAAVIVAGIIVWGFNKIDRSLAELNTTLIDVQVAIGRLEADRDSIKEKLISLDSRILNTQRAVR